MIFKLCLKHTYIYIYTFSSDPNMPNDKTTRKNTFKSSGDPKDKTPNKNTYKSSVEPKDKTPRKTYWSSISKGYRPTTPQFRKKTKRTNSNKTKYNNTKISAYLLSQLKRLLITACNYPYVCMMQQIDVLRKTIKVFQSYKLILQSWPT